MTAPNLDIRPAIAPGIVAPKATNLVILFALDPMPVSTQRLVCYWHRGADGRLVCAWEADKSPDPASLIRKNPMRHATGSSHITYSPSGEINAKFVRFALDSNPRLGPRPGHCDVKRPV